MWNLRDRQTGRRPRCGRVLLGVLGAGLLVGCVGSGLGASRWPGEEFWLDARVIRFDGEQQQVMQSFRVWRDGLALYRESRGNLRGAPLPVPVHDTVAAWQMRSESMRMLARRLRDAGLFEAGEERGIVEPPEDALLQVAWRRNDRRGVVSTLGSDDDTVERVAHVLNAFLPAERPLRWPTGELPGDPEPRRLEEVPTPRTSLEGSLQFHLDLALDDPERVDVWLLLELFALGVANGDRQVAADALQTLRAWQPQEAEAPPDPDLQRLRELFGEMEDLLPPPEPDDGGDSAVASGERAA